MFRAISFLIFIGLVLAFNLEAKVVRRAVFDFGSGTTRILVAEVDTEKNIVLNTLYKDSIRLFLSDDLAKSPDKRFSKELQTTALNIAEKLKQKALDLGATEFYGIATEAYRSAENGEELVTCYSRNLSFPIEIVTKEEEGKLGFLSLAIQKELDPHSMICCDIGGGSFQISYMDQTAQIKVYHGPYGRITTKNALITHVKNKNLQEISSPNPMTLQEWEESVQFLLRNMIAAPCDLLDKIKEPNIQIVGVAGHPPELAALGVYRSNDLIKFRDQYLNKTDQEITSDKTFFLPPYAITDLALVRALMEKLKINEFSYFETNGSPNSTALLISEKIWKNF